MNPELMAGMLLAMCGVASTILVYVAVNARSFPAMCVGVFFAPLCLIGAGSMITQAPVGCV